MLNSVSIWTGDCLKIEIAKFDKASYNDCWLYVDTE